MKDYIIVGAGIAGISFAETAFLNDKSFIVISDKSQNSSYIAAGLYNPVILKRFSMPLDAKEHLEYIKPFYRAIEERLKVKFDISLPIYRKFTSAEEQNNWFEAADKPGLSSFLSTTVVHTKYFGIDSPFGYGEVLHTGYIDTDLFLDSYHQFLDEQNCLSKNTFNHDELHVNDEYIEYKGIKAKNIVFAEGFGLHANPYFKHLPLDGTKGELLIIKAPDLKLNVAINASIFMLPIGNDSYKIGATYEWYDKTAAPTEAGRNELIEKLEELISCDYTILHHFAGIRPTVKDRKPLIGTHNLYERVHLLNGLGTRGVMLGPPMAKALFDSIENNIAVDKKVSIHRFRS